MEAVEEHMEEEGKKGVQAIPVQVVLGSGWGFLKDVPE